MLFPLGYVWLICIPPQSEGPCWLVFLNDTCWYLTVLWSSAKVVIYLFFFTGFHFSSGADVWELGSGNRCFLLDLLMFNDDSFIWCIRYTRRLCSKNMKFLALTDITMRQGYEYCLECILISLFSSGCVIWSASIFRRSVWTLVSQMNSARYYHFNARAMMF